MRYRRRAHSASNHDPALPARSGVRGRALTALPRGGSGEPAQRAARTGLTALPKGGWGR